MLNMYHFQLCMFRPVPWSPGWFGGSPPNRVDLCEQNCRESAKAYLVTGPYPVSSTSCVCICPLMTTAKTSSGRYDSFPFAAGMCRASGFGVCEGPASVRPLNPAMPLRHSILNLVHEITLHVNCCILCCIITYCIICIQAEVYSDIPKLNQAVGKSTSAASLLHIASSLCFAPCSYAGEARRGLCSIVTPSPSASI